jgi:hypothetical protein
MLPVNIYIKFDGKVAISLETDSNIPGLITPTESLKDPGTSVPWTEVVRRGRCRIKTKSNNDKINPNDR